MTSILRTWVTTTRCEFSERSYTNQGESPISSLDASGSASNVNWSVFSGFGRPIILTVAKCWDPAPQGYFTLPRSEYTSPSGPPVDKRRSRSALPPLPDEPIRPIDPAAWVSHSVAMTGAYPPYPGSSSLSTITSSSSVTETERESTFQLIPLSFSQTSPEWRKFCWFRFRSSFIF